MKKLTLISIIYRNVRKSVFVMLNYIDGKAKVSGEEMNKILTDLFGYLPRGVTYSIG